MCCDPRMNKTQTWCNWKPKAKPFDIKTVHCCFSLLPILLLSLKRSSVQDLVAASKAVADSSPLVPHSPTVATKNVLSTASVWFVQATAVKRRCDKADSVEEEPLRGMSKSYTWANPVKTSLDTPPGPAPFVDIFAHSEAVVINLLSKTYPQSPVWWTPGPPHQHHQICGHLNLFQTGCPYKSRHNSGCYNDSKS